MDGDLHAVRFSAFEYPDDAEVSVAAAIFDGEQIAAAQFGTKLVSSAPLRLRLVASTGSRKALAIGVAARNLQRHSSARTRVSFRLSSHPNSLPAVIFGR